MSEIKHVLNESGVIEIFRLVVETGKYSGVYEISEPDGWDEIDSILEINEDTFNVDNFILGDTYKIKFLQYVENSGYSLIKNVYEEQRGDGRILFQWLAVKNGVETNLLGDGFEINLNKYNEAYEKSMLRIETEIKKRESQSKLLNREDISVNLFSDKDLDNMDIVPVVTENLYYKEGSRKKTNFYFYTASQIPASRGKPLHFFLFTKADGAELGDNTNTQSGWDYYGVNPKGVFLYVRAALPKISVEISNLEVFGTRQNTTFPKYKLYAVKMNGATVIQEIALKSSEDGIVSYNGQNHNSGKIKIINETFEIGDLKENEGIQFYFKSDDGGDIWFVNQDTSCSIEIHANLSTPIRKSRIVRVKDALNQICKLYTNGQINLQSSLLNAGGTYYNSGISTGLFMRGIYSENIMATSLKSLLYDGLAPLLACGFDLQDDKMIVEPVEYFFKDIQTYDLSDKEFIQDSYQVYNDSEIMYNQLLFGGTKYSTGKTRDILNGNTELEATTPLTSVKRKFDKRTDLIIDEDKIQSVILDSSTASRNTDDDLVLIDMVEVNNYKDEGVLTNCVHAEENGQLVLYSYENPFDFFPLAVGMNLTIESGLNTGTYAILEIDKYRMILNKTVSIETGTTETPVSFIVPNLLKNRTNEGFQILQETDSTRKINPATMSNVRHNPKFQMARWFGYFGSGLSRKANSEQIIITDYKNNGAIRALPNSDDLANELQGETIYKNNEFMGRLRQNRKPFFNGMYIEITLTDVNFATFLDLYKRYRYGIGGDAATSRGYITVNTPEGSVDVFLWGKGLEHNKLYNELTIRGRVKEGIGSAIDQPKPVLQNVALVDGDTVEVFWNYSSEITSGEIQVQVSTNGGASWKTIYVGDHLQTSANITDSDFFNAILQNTELLFRVALNDSYSIVYSEAQSVIWPYNTIVYRETLRSENSNCGMSLLEFEITGTGSIQMTLNFESLPTGGSCVIYDRDTDLNVENFESNPGAATDPYSENKIVNFEISGTRRFGVELYTAKITDGKTLSCITGIGQVYLMSANLGIDIAEPVSGYALSRLLYANAEMSDRRGDAEIPSYEF